MIFPLFCFFSVSVSVSVSVLTGAVPPTAVHASRHREAAGKMKRAAGA